MIELTEEEVKQACFEYMTRHHAEKLPLAEETESYWFEYKIQPTGPDARPTVKGATVRFFPKR